MPDFIIIQGMMTGRTFSFSGDTVFIGRSAKNDIQIKDATVSRKQVKIFRIGKKFFVEDLKSTNGTLINGEKIPPGEGFEVDEGDIVTLGTTVLRLSNFPKRKPWEIAHPAKKQTVPNGAGAAPSERRSGMSGNLDLILKVSELLKGSWDVPELLERILEYIMESLPRIHRASVVLFSGTNGGGKEITEVVSKTRHEETPFAYPYSRTVVNRVMHDGKAVRMSNMTFERFPESRDKDGTLQVGSVLCVPLISSSEMRGAIYVDTIQTPYGFRKDDLRLLNSLSGSVAVALEKALSGGS